MYPGLLPASSAIKIGPGSAEGFDSAASRSGPEAVRVRGALDAVAVLSVGRGVVVALGATDGPCAFCPGAVGFDGVLATARNHQEPTPAAAVRATSTRCIFRQRKCKEPV